MKMKMVVLVKQAEYGKEVLASELETGIYKNITIRVVEIPDIDAMIAGGVRVGNTTVRPHAFMHMIAALVAAHEKISACKILKDSLCLSLKEAKQFAESAQNYIEHIK